MPKILIVDLDNTIREPISTSEYINDALDQQLIEGALGTLKIWKEKGFRIFGCSNQMGIQDKYKTVRSCYVEMLVTMELCEGTLEGIIFCPNKEGSYATYLNYENPDHIDAFTDIEKLANYRKPGNGMLRVILENICNVDWNDPSQREEVFFVGDMDSDRKAAESLEMKFIEAEDWIDA